MVSSLSTLRGLMLPTVGGDAGTWGSELNSGLTGVVDNILGQTTTLFSSNGTTVTLSAAQAQAQRITCVSCSPMTLIMSPANFAVGSYVINAGSNAVAVQSPTPGVISIVGNGDQTHVFSDGVNVTLVPNNVGVFNSTSVGTQVLITDGSTYVTGAVTPSLLNIATSSLNTLPQAYGSKAGTTNWSINSSGEWAGKTDISSATTVVNATPATAGTVGEMSVHSFPAKGLSNNVNANIGSFTPTAGCYLTWGVVNFIPSGGLASFVVSGIGTNVLANGNSVCENEINLNTFSIGFNATVTGVGVVTVTGSTAILLNGETQINTGSVTANGSLWLLRIR